MSKATFQFLIVTVVLLVGCSGSQPTDPSLGPLFAKPPSAPNVTATVPAFGKQGAVNLEVVVSGSGFDVGSVAEWDSAGVPYGGIKVNSTQFISSSQLKANITIAADATVQYYDVAVITSKGRKGIGTELFEVTFAAPIPLTNDARAVNDKGRIVAIQADQIVVYDVPANTQQSIGFGGTPTAIDQLGTTIVGEGALLWTYDGAWSQRQLPTLGGSGGSARTIWSDATGAAAVIGGYVYRKVGTGKQAVTFWNPAKWTRDGSGQWVLTLLEQPSVGTRGLLQRINGAGMAAGFDGTTCCWAFYWDVAGHATTLLPIVAGASSAAWSMNSAGTIIVGRSGGYAVTWTRVAVTDPWPAPVALDTGPCNGVAYSINDVGVIVGSSCRGATAWRPTGNGHSAIALGTIGSPCNTTCLARAVNNAVFPIAVGVLGKNSPQPSATGVYWTGF